MAQAPAKTFELAARCEDCGQEQVIPREGGMSGECCDLGDLRRFALRSSDGTWNRHPNPKRDTVDGPPQLLWNMSAGGVSYMLYAHGQPVDEISGPVLAGEKPLTLINHCLAKAFEAYVG
jgi:hypothetical protein